MLMPKRTKYRKPHRIYHEGKSKGNTVLHFGDYGLMADFMRCLRISKALW